MAFDWRAGYRASWRAYRVNPDTWADAGVLGGVTEASVERGLDSVGETLESGSMSVDLTPGESFEPGYYRIVLYAEQDGDLERVEVATLWCESTNGRIERGVDEVSVTCASVLHPAETGKLEAGSYAPAKVNGADFVASMLRDCINAPVVSEGSFTLDEAYVFEPGEPVITACWKVLDAGNYNIRIAGDGMVRIAPKGGEPVLQLDQANARLMHPGVDHALDMSEVPNRYTAVDGTQKVTAVNDDPASPTSTASRGFDSTTYDSSPVRVNGETMRAYADRRLEEESTLDDERTYTREWWPDVVPGDTVRGSLASVGIEGDMRVKSQSLEIGRGVVVTETSAREVVLWRR